ncbi:uncharacterized protein LOC126610894 isoform X3 [Malus sylvestris]|uniref:uncharacterized protein LOC126610894 isoform X3 n=1 Tax=Malus sylvestris TaxID=3752 RepID=UPI0010A9A59F|nr:uncharacterized protein LOC114822514 isoform X3 [Malus domestica]XP_050135005.1 uncharacterized protein LOC126610894 isoform X3 [Malus sylvestris]
MAATCCFSPASTSIQKSGPVLKPFSRVLRFKNSLLTVKIKSSTLQIRSSLREEVFEDRANGIICYKDDRGEIICEGFDEGPRYHQHKPTTPWQPSDFNTPRLASFTQTSLASAKKRLQNIQFRAQTEKTGSLAG